MASDRRNRKGYQTIEKQIEANERYLAKNPHKRKDKNKSSYKSSGKLFLSTYANLEELEEFKDIISVREKYLKGLNLDKKEIKNNVDNI